MILCAVSSFPKKLDYSLPEEIDAQMKDNLPDLFDTPYQSVLYVGASHLRQHFLLELVEKYKHITILEIYSDNIKYLTEKYTDKKISIIQGDVRDADKLHLDKFDVCVFWHGPEHLHKEEVQKILDKLESLTKHLIVLGMPYGHYLQGSEYGNDYETHCWDIYPEDMANLGYSVNTIGKADDTLSNMMAWKFLQE